MKATGTNTATNTKAIPITGPCTFSIALIAASFGGKPLYFNSYSTASTTTIASSTTRPIANTMANNVNVLIEKSSNTKAPNVPSKDTGTAIIGMIVDLQDCRNTYTTIRTSNNASTKVCSTSLMEALTNLVLSTTTLYCISGGKDLDCSSSTFLTFAIVSNAFASFCKEIAKPATSLCADLAIKSYPLAPI